MTTGVMPGLGTAASACGEPSGSCRNELGLENGCGRATETASFLAHSTLSAFAVPDERRWRSIPARHPVLQPGDQLLHGFRMLSAQRSAVDDALHRFGHIQPRSAEWRVQ